MTNNNKNINNYEKSSLFNISKKNTLDLHRITALILDGRKDREIG
jgi:hypothetical protein